MWMTSLQDLHSYKNQREVFQCSDWWGFWAWATADCKTSNEIYLIECQKCGKQYVGTENPFTITLNGHKSHYYLRLPDKWWESTLMGRAIHFVTLQQWSSSKWVHSQCRQQERSGELLDPYTPVTDPTWPQFEIIMAPPHHQQVDILSLSPHPSSWWDYGPQ